MICNKIKNSFLILKVFFAFRIVMSLFLCFPILAYGQNRVVVQRESKQTDRDWWMRVLWTHGFPDFLKPESLPALQKSLGITDDQMKTIDNTSFLFRRYREVESHLEDPSKGNPLFSQCVEGAIQLRNSLGAEKFDDFCEWSWEDLVIFKSSNRSMRKDDDYQNFDDLADLVFKEINDSKSYSKYKENKTGKLGSSGTASRYFSNHDKVLKLRILHELYENKKPMGGLNPNHVDAQRLKRKRREVLRELNGSGRY